MNLYRTDVLHAAVEKGAFLVLLLNVVCVCAQSGNKIGECFRKTRGVLQEDHA